MNTDRLQDILPLIELPSRYTGGEINSIKKDPATVALRFALAFPDLYEIGTSHFGMQILYTILNRKQMVYAERFFTPAPDMEARLKKTGTPLLSLETHTDLKQFDIIGFSLLYELNFTNILTMLDLSGIPFFSKDRDLSWPLVIGGGPCAFNPEPLADFFDAFVIGDGEIAIQEMSDIYLEWKKSGDGQKQTLLSLWSDIQGVYIPSFFNPELTLEGFQILEPLHPDKPIIKRAILPDLMMGGFPELPVIPFGKPVHDRLRLEIARGCSRGCRFCQAGMIYRPVRERSVDDLLSLARQSLNATGYSDISLLSLSTGDYSSLEPLMASLLALEPGYCTAISLPSVRAGKLTPELMAIIKKVRKTGFTIAPEAGTQRLRDVINKNITEQDIMETVYNAFNLGWRTIKLYFMHGLPTETQEDIQAICDLSRRLAGMKFKGKGRSQITISLAPFIPKPHTPFQHHPQITKESALENLHYVKQNLRHPGINLKWHDPEMSLLEGAWSRGDRRLAKVLVAAWEKGCRLDGWSDRFRPDLWQEAFSDTGVDPGFYTTRSRTRDEILPWGHIDPGIPAAFFENEAEKAYQGEITPDCREGDCQGCGICNFNEIQPILHDRQPGSSSTSKPELANAPEIHFSKFRFFYSKLGNARFFGHLELGKILRRAIRRANIRVNYSQGFNPTMKLSFDNPLPLGMASEEEFFTLSADIKYRPEDLVESLNHQLPEGIRILRCIPAALLKKNLASETVTYAIELNPPGIEKEKIESFITCSEFEVLQTNFKGKTRKTDLRKAVQRIDFLDSTHLEMILKEDQGRILRPADLLTQVFGISQEDVQTAKILKLKPVCRPS